MKIFLFLAVVMLSRFQVALAQDFIIKNNDDVIRGTIKGTDYFSVFISANDETDMILPAKDIKNFFWNGNSYLSKGFATGKNLEYRFVKVIETGKVNLYSFGGERLQPVQKEKRVKFRPSIGIGTGSYGGMGMGGGISIGSGRNNAPEPKAGAPVIRYFIEKLGMGPLQEIPVKAITDDTRKAAVKAILLQKLGDDQSIKTRIEATTDLNTKEVTELVRAYNETNR